MWTDLTFNQLSNGIYTDKGSTEYSWLKITWENKPTINLQVLSLPASLRNDLVISYYKTKTKLMVCHTNRATNDHFWYVADFESVFG